MSSAKMVPLQPSGNDVFDAALYFFRRLSYPLRVTNLSFSASYYYGFFGYNPWRPRSRAQ
jgi:hypothetical protein